MRRRSIPLAALMVLFLIQVPAAHAKGPTGAIIEGDGVKGAVEVRQSAELGQGTALGRLGEAVGLFELAFGNSSDVTAEQPTKSLGESRLVITWDMGAGYSIIQEIYPHAVGGPVSHVASGQAFFKDSTAVGGWFIITGDFVTPLGEVGVDQAAISAQTKKATASKAVEPPAKKATVLANAAQVESAAAEAAPPGSVDGARIAAAVLLLAGIIGAGVWMRRRPVLR